MHFNLNVKNRTHVFRKCQIVNELDDNKTYLYGLLDVFAINLMRERERERESWLLYFNCLSGVL